MADPYQTLGVARGASEADIKKAYRKLAKELHPDRNKDNPKASERFSQVTNAYDLLTDKDKRARFDRGEIDGDGNPAAPFGYGGARPGAARGGPGGFSSAGYEFGTGGESGEMTKEATLAVYSTIGWWTIGIAVVVLALSPLIRRLMHLDTLKDEAGHAMAGESELAEPQAAGVRTSGETRH